MDPAGDDLNIQATAAIIDDHEDLRDIADIDEGPGCGLPTLISLFSAFRG